MLPLRLRASLVAMLLSVLTASIASAQGIGIVDGIPYTFDRADTAISPHLPAFPDLPAGSNGFLWSDGEGSFTFGDGKPARFFGVSLQWSACFPDSLQAITVAARLRKLGVNLVRFQFMDNAFNWGGWATFLDEASGFRSIHPERMKRFDWFVYQLKMRGIYIYLPLQSSRAPLASDGLGPAADSTLWLSKELNFLYPAARATNQLIAQLLLNHVNPHTGVAYKSEPAIAMIEVVDQGSLISMYRQGLTEYRAGEYGLSYRNSRRLDTLYADFLKKKYSSTAALDAAWRITPPPGGFPNLVQEGSFEGDFSQVWDIQAYDGPSVTPILAQGDSVPQGAYSLSLRIRNTRGDDSTLYSVFMQQAVPLEFNTIYLLTYKAKSTHPEGHKVHIVGSGEMYAGLSQVRQVMPYWREDSVLFIMPYKGNLPVAIIFYCGSNDGELKFDDVKIRKFEALGTLPGESLESSMITRIPWGNAAAAFVGSKRIEDQSEFYLSLERDYLDGMRRYVSDTLGAKSPVTGAGHYWASGFMETTVQAQSDFTMTSAGWDWVSGGTEDWQIRNYSPLRTNYGGAIYSMALGAHRRQPFVGAFSHPFPNRYQAESMLFVPAYSSLQDWDGLIWDIYADNDGSYMSPEKFIDTGMHYQAIDNPVVNALMPAVAQLFRSRLLAPAQTTINVQHSTQQALILPRMEGLWGSYAVPGGMNGRAMLVNRLVTDSVNAQYPTQADDISFASEVPGMAQSDTREIIWEYNRGSFAIDAETAQGVSGYLTRAGGITLQNLDVGLLSLNETATLLWVPLDPAKPLAAPGRSFLVLASRTEPTGWLWRDSTHADRWGAGPMLLDPMRVRLTFKPDNEVNVVRITPLDSTGMPSGAPIVAKRSGSSIVATIDQATTRAVWYSVELANDPSAAVELDAVADGILTARPSVVTDRTYITISLPNAVADGALELFDPLGRRVRLIRTGAIEPGSRVVRLDAEDLPAGAYIVRLRTEKGVMGVGKITVVK